MKTNKLKKTPLTKEEDPKTFSPNERLRFIRSQLRLTRAYLCEKYGLSTETLKAWENGKLTLTEKALKRCIDIYRSEGVVVSKSWILTGEGLDPRMSFELNQYFSETNELHTTEKESDEFLMLREIDFFKHSTKNSVVLLISTEEMLPYYSPGDYVGGRLYAKERAKELIGKDCIIVTQQGEKYFRRLSYHNTDNTYNLACHNPSWGGTLEPVFFDVDIKLIAPIVWHRRPDV